MSDSNKATTMQVRTKVAAEISDDHVNLEITMNGLPSGATEFIQENHREFINAIRQTIIEFMGSQIYLYRTETVAHLVSDNGPIDSNEIEQAVRNYDNKSKSLN